MLTGSLASLVLSTFAKPTTDMVILETVPVNAGIAHGAFESSAD